MDNIRGRIGLTDAKIKGLKPGPTKGRVEYLDSVVPGLRVRVGASGAKSFIIRKRIGGKFKTLTLGTYNEVRFNLAEARRKARVLLSDMEAGGDPTAKLKQETAQKGASGTVRALWQAYQQAEVTAKRSAGEITRIFDKYVLPELGDRMADMVTRGDITRLIDGIAATGATVMARAVRAQISAFYSWALPRLDRLETNPARDAGRPSAPPSRDRVLSDAELRALWSATDAMHFPWRAGIKLLVLTGQRRDEVFNADRTEFDLEQALWTIPSSRAKNGIEHLVPLATQAVAILKIVPEIAGSTKLFPARGNNAAGASGFSKTTEKLRRIVQEAIGEPIDDWRLHDIRRTMATGMQRLGIKLEVVEAVLNHISGTRAGVVGIYQRHSYLDEKKHALQAWADEVGRIVQGRPSGKIVPIREAR